MTRRCALSARPELPLCTTRVGWGGGGEGRAQGPAAEQPLVKKISLRDETTAELTMAIYISKKNLSRIEKQQRTKSVSS
jgi:hypothetical protein